MERFQACRMPEYQESTLDTIPEEQEPIAAGTSMTTLVSENSTVSAPPGKQQLGTDIQKTVTM